MRTLLSCKFLTSLNVLFLVGKQHPHLCQGLHEISLFIEVDEASACARRYKRNSQSKRARDRRDKAQFAAPYAETDWQSYSAFRFSQVTNAHATGRLVRLNGLHTPDEILNRAADSICDSFNDGIPQQDQVHTQDPGL